MSNHLNNTMTAAGDNSTMNRMNKSEYSAIVNSDCSNWFELRINGK
jgi:hypothetical protein